SGCAGGECTGARVTAKALFGLCDQDHARATRGRRRRKWTAVRKTAQYGANSAKPCTPARKAKGRNRSDRMAKLLYPEATRTQHNSRAIHSPRSFARVTGFGCRSHAGWGKWRTRITGFQVRAEPSARV